MDIQHFELVDQTGKDDCAVTRHSDQKLGSTALAVKRGLSVSRQGTRSCEFAIGEAQSCNRTAKAFGIRPFQIKAWLECCAGQRRADSFTLDPQCTNWHRAVAH